LRSKERPVEGGDFAGSSVFPTAGEDRRKPEKKAEILSRREGRYETEAARRGEAAGEYRRALEEDLPPGLFTVFFPPLVDCF
jgi:hypothetical protein